MFVFFSAPLLQSFGLVSFRFLSSSGGSGVGSDHHVLPPQELPDGLAARVLELLEHPEDLDQLGVLWIGEPAPDEDAVVGLKPEGLQTVVNDQGPGQVSA